MTPGTLAERTGRDRGIALISLTLIAGLAWVYLWREAQSMAVMPMGPAAAGMADIWSPDAALAMFLMWTVMMCGMMLPSAAPAILLYTRMVRGNAEHGIVLGAVWLFVAGYLAAWTGFSAAATALQLTLRESSLLSAGLSSASPWLSSGLLLTAGIYQWLPIKHACLEKCQSPLAFFMSRWKAGRLGSLQMGWAHGWICVGCCWSLMLLLFVAGVMNLLWIAVLAAYVLVEKLLPPRLWTARVSGAGLVIAGLAVAFLA